MIFIIFAYLLCGISYAARDLGSSLINRPGWTHKTTGIFFHVQLIIVILAWFLFRPRLYAFRGTPWRKKKILFGYFWALIFIGSMSLFIWISYLVASHVTENLIVHLLITMIVMFSLNLFLLPVFSKLMNKVEIPFMQLDRQKNATKK